MGKIMHGGIEYSGGGGGGGGGSTVTITPTLSTGTKIADFEIDGASGELYAPQSGGGGSYSVTTLYTGTTINATTQISDSFDNYDALQFTSGFLYNGRTYLVSATILKQDLDDALTDNKWITMGFCGSDSYCFGQVTANNTFSNCYGRGYLYSIKGIKY